MTENKDLLKQYVKLVIQKSKLEKKVSKLASYRLSDDYKSEESEDLDIRIGVAALEYIDVDGKLDDVAFDLKLHKIRFDLN